MMARTTEQVFQAHLSTVQSGDVQQVIADYADDALLVEWSAESEGASLAHAVDTYLIQGGKIIRPTTRFRWIPK